jgi:hypothetical protein
LGGAAPARTEGRGSETFDFNIKSLAFNGNFQRGLVQVADLNGIPLFADFDA